MEYKEIELEHEEDIERIRRKYGHILMSHSFATLFLWEKPLGLKIFLEDDFFVIKMESKGSNAYFFPCGNDDKKREFIIDRMNVQGFSLYYMREEDVFWLKEQFPNKFVIEEDETSCEYIFDKQGHLEYAGKKYAKLRYAVNKLSRESKLYTVQLKEETLTDAINVLENWEQVYYSKHDATGDYKVAKKALSNFKKMKLSGTITYRNGEPAAVVIGKDITEDTCGIQVAKIGEPVDGLIFYALREYFRTLPEKIVYINGDDDMGIEGIRIHKKKMQPCRLNEVWRAECLL